MLNWYYRNKSNAERTIRAKIAIEILVSGVVENTWEWT